MRFRPRKVMDGYIVAVLSPGAGILIEKSAR